MSLRTSVSLADLRVLVTGGAGYVGSVLVPRLHRLGARVTVLDVRRGSAPKRPPLAVPDVTFVHGDVRDRGLLEPLLLNADAVVHLAALVGYRACDADPAAAESVNRRATAELARRVGGRPLVFASTASVYGEVAAGVCDEDTPVSPRTLYARTKAEAEKPVLAAGGTVLRPVTGFGLAPRTRWDLLVHHLLLRALRTGVIELYDPEAFRPLVSVQDIAEAVLVCLRAGSGAAGRILNVAVGSLNLTKREIARAIANTVDAEVRRATCGQDPDGRTYRVRADRLNALGFSPTSDLARALDELTAAARATITAGS